MAVRVVLPEGETVFTFATSAVSRGGAVAVFAWNTTTNTLEEVALFDKSSVVAVEVLKGAAVGETIRGYATARQAASEAPLDPPPQG
jgi:hypothetical protein